jgi:hypothetical protein
MSGKLSAFSSSEQLNLDDVLAEFEGDEIITDSDNRKGYNPEEAVTSNGTCPYTQECEARRRRLPHYRPTIPCHWVAWGDWQQRCPIYKNGGIS